MSISPPATERTSEHTHNRGDHSPHAHAPLAAPGGNGRTATSLGSVLTFTFLNSIGSAVVYGGIFFLAKSQYGFTSRDNFLLALVYGLVYIPGALSAGPLLRRLALAGVSARTVLGVIMLAMAGLCLLPWLATVSQGTELEPSVRARWGIWLAVSVYSPLSGALWPIVESFLAGGRSEEALRSATGKFNICWSGAIVVTMFGMSRLVETQPILVLNCLGVVHASCVVVLRWFTKEPGAHAPHHVRVNQEHYQRLLSVLRILLPVAFLFISALSPYLPEVLKQLSVPATWGTIVAAVWYGTRVMTFFGMERWHGWHGRWSTPLVGLGVLMVSFGMVVLAPMAGGAGGSAGKSAGFAVLLAGLSGFGVGVGIIYAAALYYAMEVGSDGVDAGGMHETLIGIGYTTGPGCGLLAGAVVSGGWAAESQFEYVMIGLVCGLALVVSAWGVIHAKRHAARG